MQHKKYEKQYKNVYHYNSISLRRFEFAESTLLTSWEKADYQTFWTYKWVTIFPYAFTQFWFYEFYQMGLPIFMPSVELLPLFINQDYPRHSH